MNLTDEELVIIINSVHERGMSILQAYKYSCQKGTTWPNGKATTKEDQKLLKKSHDDHMALVEKIRGMRNG